MKSKRLIPFILSCLLIMETPFVSQAAEPSTAPNPAAGISVQEEVPDNSQTNFQITLNQNTASLNVGDTLQLTPFYSGYNANAANKPQIAWSVDRTDIISVSDQGLVTAIKAGNATVTAAATLTADGSAYTASSSCTVTVTDTITLKDRKSVV